MIKTTIDLTPSLNVVFDSPRSPLRTMLNANFCMQLQSFLQHGPRVNYKLIEQWSDAIKIMDSGV